MEQIINTYSGFENIFNNYWNFCWNGGPSAYIFGAIITTYLIVFIMGLQYTFTPIHKNSWIETIKEDKNDNAIDMLFVVFSLIGIGSWPISILILIVSLSIYVLCKIFNKARKERRV